MVYSQTYYYACNENYVIQNTILENDIRSHEYYIQLLVAENRETYTYYKNNEVQKILIITVEGIVKKEEEWEADILIAERTYKHDRLLTEKLYSKTFASYEKHEYVYTDELLEKITVTTPDNKTYAIEYFYDKNKKIRALSINNKIISLSQFGTASLITRWNQDVFSIEIYNAKMLLHYQYNYNSLGEIILEGERIYQGNKLVTIRQKNYKENTEIIISYDDSLIVEEQTVNLQKRNLLETIQYIYTDEKLLQKKIILTPKETIVFEYTYNDKKIYEEKKYVNGVYKQYKRWISNSTYISEIYEDKNITIVITYTNEKKVKEEAWQNSIKLYEKVYE